MKTIPEYFGSMVFDEREMKSRLTAKAYKSLKKTINCQTQIDLSVANAVAQAMKEWAISKGATHFTHWFQPLTGITAEKHESFITPSLDGGVIMEFSGKELIKGEPDASSFPNGGLRATFEARGYTAWDPTSYAFIKDKTLCIPTAFCSYDGNALDKKTPLLRSMEALNKQALRILCLFGNDHVQCVRPYVGPEQEYFLITKEMYEQRPDLIFCGRTLFGAKAPKGQEMDDHYFGVIKPRVAAFMEELDEELWKLGIYAKTKHNEVAPSQHELAPIYTSVNVACDQNQLTMEMMQKIAGRHGLVCLLHEKPFAGVNGSGKHNNWSLATDSGQNLLSPGDTPYENAQFLLFLCAVIQAVDDYSDLLRLSVATAGNDHRLGANEAPPAIVSIFLGDELNAVLEAIENDTPYKGTEKIKMKLGVDVLPKFSRDTTDRNRTSPFAFTGNKFEFRMVGSSLSPSFANVVLNTITADALNEIADQLSVLKYRQDIRSKALEICTDILRQHQRILFSGDGYSEEWVEEARRRGLPNIPSFIESVSALTSPKTISLFTRNHIYTEKELLARSEIMSEQYVKITAIEAKVLIDMTKTEIIPLIVKEIRNLAETAANLSKPAAYFARQLDRLNEILDRMDKMVTLLEEKDREIAGISDTHERGIHFYHEVSPLMEQLRQIIDEHETFCDKKQYSIPSYEDMLYHSH